MFLLGFVLGLALTSSLNGLSPRRRVIPRIECHGNISLPCAPRFTMRFVPPSPGLPVNIALLPSFVNASEAVELQVAREFFGQDVDAVLANDGAPSLPAPRDIAVVTYMVRRPAQDFGLYEPFVPFSFRNLLAYTLRHGYPFFFAHEHLVPLDLKNAAYWGKMNVLRHYLQLGYPWVLWTDLDVLIMQPEMRLERFLDPAIVPASADLVGMLECGWGDNIAGYVRSIRSGFFFLRNSPRALAFLDAWQESYAAYQDSLIPEQQALEDMFSSPDSPWRDIFFVYPPCRIHTYPECYRPGMFSVHFPADRKSLLPTWANHTPGAMYNGSLDIFMTRPTLTTELFNGPNPD